MIGNQHLWGESWTIYRDKSVWVVGFKGKKGGSSSLHRHEYMANHFFVKTGVLGLHDKRGFVAYVQPGASFAFAATKDHQLTFGLDTEGIETYYALPGHEIDENDIIRLSPGRAS